jgi:hypothetical protein
VSAEVNEPKCGGCGDCCGCLSALPDGKTCGDCRHADRCVRIFASQRTDLFCQFVPMRWSPAHVG